MMCKMHYPEVVNGSCPGGTGVQC